MRFINSVRLSYGTKGAALAAWALSKLPFVGYRTLSKRKALRRSLGMAIPLVLVLGLFRVSGLFISYITKTAG